MKKLLLLFSLTLFVDRAFAFPFFDPFADRTSVGGTSYAVGSDLGGQSDGLGNVWNSIGTGFPGTHPIITSGNLSYPNLPASTGNSVAFFPSTTGQQSARLNFNYSIPASSTRAYYSFKLTLTDISSVPTTATNNYFVCFSDSGVAQSQRLGRAGTRVVVKKSGAGFVLGVARNDNSPTFTDYVFDTTVYNVNDTLFVVGSYDKIGGTTNVNLWVNPPSATFGSNAAPAATVSAVTFTTPNGDLSANVAGFVISGQNFAAPSGIIDDVAIGTNWATVTGGPGIYLSPTNQTRNAGSNVTFTAAAFGNSLSYQWQKNGSPLNNGGNISGATTTALTISSVLAADAASYAMVASNSYAMATSAVATLTVNDPWITVQPTNKAVNPGSATVLHVVAVGTPTLTYQWYQNNSPLSDGGHFSGSQSPDLTITSFSSTEVGTYNVVVMNGLSSSVTSSNAVISLTDPSITSQPQSVTNIYGSNAVLQVTATGTAPLTYQWHKQGFGDLSDGGNISGSHSNILTITAVSVSDGGTYSVTVSNALGAFVDSAPAVLTVRDPAVVTQPVSVTNSIGTTVSFHAAAVGTPSVNYIWYKGNNIFLSDDGVKYAGTSTDTLWVTNVQAGDQTNYYVTVFGGSGGQEISVDAFLTVTSPPVPITITAQPTPRKVLAGSQTVLAVGYTGSGAQFQWQHAGTNLPGATASALVLPNVQSPDTGAYQVIVTNSINGATSDPVTVSVVPSLNLYPTNIVALRVGNGAQALTTHGNSIFVDQWSPDGTYLTTMNIPDNGSDSVVAIGPTLTVSPSSVTGNGLSRSANGSYLVFGGYNTNLTFTNELQSTAANIVPRAIGLLDNQGQYTLAVSSTNTSTGNFWRGACYDGTNNYWGCSRTSSTYYLGFDAPGVVLTDWTNLRAMGIFNNRIYGVSAVSGKTGVMRLSGLPKTAETVEFVINTGSNFSSDCDVSPNGNLIYVADSLTTGGGGIQRWEFNGSTWNLAYTLTDHVAAGAYYVTADFSGANPVVYAVTTEADNNQIVRISDTGAGSTGTVVAYAGVNQNFRGIRLGPAAASVGPALLSITPAPGAVILNWSGVFNLQSATNVTGPYTDVTNTSPYTNSTSGAQMFFRLRQ